MIGRVDYGIDAPDLRRGFLAVAGGALTVAIGLTVLGNALPAWRIWPIVAFAVVACYALGMAGLMTWGSRVGKVRGREAIIALVDWTGGERVLDVACGRGLMMIGAAKRLTTGHATGIDLWLNRDQSGNDPDAARANAVAEGVADRVEIVTGDMRALPFADRTFDVVLSHWGVHNLDTATDRSAALAEMVRVARPGASILVTDIACRGEYLGELARLGLNDVRPVVASPALDLFYGAVSFGSYRPATVAGRVPG